MTQYPEITKSALALALSKPKEKRTRCDRLLLLLQSGEWVGSLALALNGAGLDYTARICELRKQGVQIEIQRSPITPKGEQWYEYRLKQVDHESAF
jgi:hypothetical protein